MSEQTAPIESAEQTAPVVVDEQPHEQTSPTPFDITAAIAAGYRFETGANGWHVTNPAGRHGHGATPADAVANIDAAIIPDETGRRVLHRADGTTVVLDRAPRDIASEG